MKVISLIGARPQFVKSAVLSKELEYAGVVEVIAHSGQHYDYNMSGIFFEALGMRKPDYNLGVGPASHSKMMANVMVELEKSDN